MIAPSLRLAARFSRHRLLSHTHRARGSQPAGRRKRMTGERRTMTRVLTGVTLIDGVGRGPIADAAVVIEGERIAAAGPRAAVAWPADAAMLDLRGRTVLPGLIDAHDH